MKKLIKNVKERKIMMNLPFDPNIAVITANVNAIIEAAKHTNTTPEVNLKFVHLKPHKLLVDKPNKFKAIYKDDFGKYSFAIKRTDNNYTVIVDNKIVSKTDDKDCLIWNFEVQLAAITPRILD